MGTAVPALAGNTRPSPWEANAHRPELLGPDTNGTLVCANSKAVRVRDEPP